MIDSAFVHFEEEVTVLTRTKKLAIALTTAGLLVVGGTSFAVGAATSSQTVNACYATKTGNLRYLKAGSCKSGEKKIAWNVKGVKGSTGTRGKTGATGAAGAPGADGTVVVSAEGNGAFGGIAINSAGAEVAQTTITMPRSGYLVANGVATLESEGGQYSAAICSFLLDGKSVGFASGITTVGPNTIDAPVFGTTRFFAPAGAHTVSWQCRRQSQGDSTLYNANFTLISTQ